MSLLNRVPLNQALDETEVGEAPLAELEIILRRRFKGKELEFTLNASDKMMGGMSATSLPTAPVIRQTDVPYTILAKLKRNPQGNHSVVPEEGITDRELEVIERAIRLVNSHLNAEALNIEKK